MTSRSMNTVQRSPRRIGAAEERASSANSPMIWMPSFSACSSRNEPVPAAQASFMAKSTTMPSCREMNFESWPPISKIVSTVRPICRAMKSAPVLWAVISSVTRSAPRELADQLAPGAGRADPAQADAVAELVADLGEALVDDLDRARVGLGVDLLEHVDPARRRRRGWSRPSRRRCPGRRRPAASRATRRASPCRAAGARAPSTSGSATGNSAAGRRPSSRATAPRSRASLRSASSSAAPTAPMRGVVLGHDQAAVVEAEGLAQGAHGALVGGDPADERHRRLDQLALGDGALEVADHGVAEAAQHLGRLVALLLGVDHVALGEDAAAPGDAGRLAGAEHDVADVLDLVEQAARLLVHEGAGAGGAVAVALVVGDADRAAVAGRLEADELGGLAAHLEDGDDVGVQGGDPAGDGLELVLEVGLERLAHEAAAGARHAHAGDGAVGQGGAQVVEEALDGLARAPLDAPVGDDEQRPAVDQGEPVGRGLEEGGVVAQQPLVQPDVVGTAHEGGLQTDAADIDTEPGHGGDIEPPRGVTAAR